MTYDAGYLLRLVDPTAFRCAMADEPVVWVCPECEAEFEEYDEAQECCADEEDEEEDEIDMLTKYKW